MEILGTVLQTLAMLSLVLALLLFVSFVARRAYGLKIATGADRMIRVLDCHYMTPKERIALIDVAGEKLVVGITPEKITCLAHLEKEETLGRIDKRIEKRTGKLGGNGAGEIMGFGDRLRLILGRGPVKEQPGENLDQ